MQYVRTSSGWSVRFKRQLVSWTIMAATPLLQLVSHFSSLPKPVIFRMSIASFALILLGCAYVFKNLTSKPEPPMSRRESCILGSLLTVVLALSIANGYFLFGGAPSHATPLR